MAAGILMTGAIEAKGASPKVVITSPDNGEVDVSPEIKEIRIEFDQAMDVRSQSVVGGGEQFPEIAGQIRWERERICIIPVKLMGEHAYRLSVNSDTFKGFRNKAGEPAEWYPIAFTTRAAGAEPAAPDVTPEQNKSAVAALRKAIDEDYAYRDRLKVDWGKEIDARLGKLEGARTANEFARVTGHMLRLAEDPHVSVNVGQVYLWTRPNSASPNYNVAWLERKVPEWTLVTGGGAWGRPSEEIGYIAFAQCSNEGLRGFDASMEKLKGTKGLIIDARFNGGGDEGIAQQVAGWFVTKRTVYSKDRIREDGAWNGPMERAVEPRKGVEHYQGKIVVLIGPKVMSSAESFVLMMKEGAGAKLAGETTRGSSGRPVAHALGNGVTVYLPSWEDQFVDGRLLEGVGVKPDVEVKVTPRELQNGDPVLSAGLKVLGE
jgi:hypothetical protein